jgi:hypothetical protein
MSTAESWDLVVPEDDAELGAELRRHGLKPGQRVRVSMDGVPKTITISAVTGNVIAGKEAPEGRRLRFTGLIEGPSDLSSRTDDYLAQGFGRD